MANRRLDKDRSRGAALVEFAFTVGLFLALVMAIIEFSLLVMVFSRVNEMTRDLVRMAIVSDPVCDIHGNGCPGPVSGLSCPGGAAIRLTLADMAGSCGDSDNSTACTMLRRARLILPDIEPGEIELTYACSGAGADVRPLAIPLVSVAATGMRYRFIAPGLLGIDASVAIPAFETSRTGEDLYTEREL